METTILEHDIIVFYLTASSYPDGIMDAHKALHTLVPFSAGRKYFGLSRPENGSIVYRAAAEELYEGEARQYHCDTLVLKKGTYISKTIRDYMKDIASITITFKTLLSHPGKDPQGYCVEWYINDSDVTCMVRLED